ncbi:MAG: HAD family phosphatase [Chloroflexi bacterium]|nr:HAD family phosphatase [Chloroflexota bacterium]
MQQDGTVRAIFFDFGGVIARLDRGLLAELEVRYGLPKGSFIKALYTIPEWRAAEIGEGTEEAWVAAVRRKLDEFAGRPLPDIRSEWAVMWRTLDADVLRLIERLGGRYDVGLISNSTPRLEGELRDHHKIDGLFKVIVNSALVGIAKPDARIYHLAAERMGVEPSACVHIDDLAHNVEGAREAGFQAIHHEGDYATLERELRSLGVQW